MNIIGFIHVIFGCKCLLLGGGWLKVDSSSAEESFIALWFLVYCYSLVYLACLGLSMFKFFLSL
jgi:hypothetical protein